MITDNQLDLMYGTLLNDVNLNPYEVPEVSTNGITFFKQTDDAFSLKDPTYFIKSTKIDESLTLESNINGFIIRTALSYSHASKFNNNYLYGLEMLSIIKNNMLVSAAKYVDLNRCYRVTFARPSIPSTFFRELTNSAGFELRLYVQFRNNEVVE